MADNQKIIFITGPTGAGKSTVSRLLADSIDRCANIDVDHIKHFTEFGFDTNHTAAEHTPYIEWKLVGEATAKLAELYLSRNCSIIINGYIDESAWNEIRKTISPTHTFLLLPTLETLKTRDALRSESVQQGERESERHFEYFSNTAYFKDFDTFDTSGQSVQETVEMLGIKINSPNDAEEL